MNDLFLVAFIEEFLFDDGAGENEPAGEITEYDDAITDDLITALSGFNIKETEEKVAECVKINYGPDINQVMRDVKNQLDIFDYHKAKELLTDLKRRRNESGI